MRENISELQQGAFTALLDNELASGQIDDLSQEINRNQSLRQQFARHQMISGGLKGEQVHPGVLNLADVVSERLRDEPTVLAPSSWHHTRRWIQPLAGTALAASVAALGIAFAPQLMQQDTLAPPLGIQVVAQPVTPLPVQAVQKQEQNWKTLQSPPGKELAPYLQDHSEYAVQGVMPYASYVSYDKRKH